EQRQNQRVPAPLQEVQIGIVKNAHTALSGSRRQMLSFCADPAGRFERIHSNIVRETNTAVNTLLSRPNTSVVANPRIGPVPNWNRNAAEISEETWVSKMVRKTR